MKDKFLDQKEILTSLKHEISLLHQQIDYLLRNGRALGLLDLDVMMNRTHTIYDQLCSISLGEDEATGEEEVAPEMLNALFGSLSGDESDTDPVANTEPEKKDEEEPMEEPTEEQEPAEVPTPAEESIVEEPTEEPMEEPEEEPEEETTEEPMEEPEEEEKTEEISFDFNLTAEDPEVVETVSDEEPSLWFDQPEPAEENEEVIPEEPVEEPEEPVEEPEEPEEISFDFNFTAEDPEVVEATPDEEPAAEKEETDYGFIFKMEPIPEPEEAPAKKPAQTYTTGDQIELEIPHFDFPESDEPAEDSDTEKPQEEEFPEEEPLTEEDFHEEEPLTEEDFPKEEGTEEEFIEDEASQEEESNEEEESVEEEESAEEEESNEAEPVVEKEPGDDFPYEPVVFGDMEEKDDLGFELETHETIGEKLHVKTLKSAIGINDKFLLVNELFGGNMGKYERSMDNLDDLKTLNGALIYMNELRVELQWNSNNEAYKKLLELVHRKFED